MKPQRPLFFALALLAVAANACFDDPTSDLRNGPSYVTLSTSVANIKPGDSLAVFAQVRDAQGNVLTAADATWSTANATVATVRRDTDKPAPGGFFSRAWIVALAAGSSTTVTVSLGGASADIAVIVLP